MVRTFKAAKARLTDPPALLITELKLGEYNGLHLAVRSRTTGVPAIVVADKSFEQDTEQLGAVWLSPENAAGDELQSAMTRLLQGPDAIHAVYPWYEETGSEPATARLEDFGDPASPRVLH